MEKEYIERETAIVSALKGIRRSEVTSITALQMVEELENIPAADVVEVVRCKDCIYNHIGNCMFSKEITPDYDPEYYCAGGERIEDGSE